MRRARKLYANDGRAVVVHHRVADPRLSQSHLHILEQADFI